MKKNTLVYIPAFILLIILSALIMQIYSEKESMAFSKLADNQQIEEEITIEKQNFPDHGTTIMNTKLECLAPLEINTPNDDNYYYIVLLENNTNENIIVYLHPNELFKTEIPLGNYHFYYAVGKNWYGDEELFGLNTACMKADQPINFYTDMEKNMHMGHFITLIDSYDGNMNNSPITKSQLLNITAEKEN